MPITFAGIGITPLHEHQQEVDYYWHSHVIEEFEFQAYFVPNANHLPGPYIPDRRPPRIGVFSWPVCADKWATCHLVATGAQVVALRAVIGTAPTAQTLTISDGDGGTISAPMYLLPPRPIAQKGTDEWYLLTLVDERWFWYMAGAAAPSVFSSWDALLTSLFAFLGVTNTSDGVDSAYLTPNQNRWNTGAAPIPLLIEAAVRQNGLRVVRRLDGTVDLTSYTTASADDAARWTDIQTLVLAGGRLTAPDLGRSSPASVDVAFFDGTTVNQTLTGLSLSAFGGVSGVASRTGRVTADPAAPSPAERTQYALKASQDYYNWSLSLTDATLRGIVDLYITGLDGIIEWIHVPAGCVTRIIRPEWSDRNIYGDAFAPGIIPPGWIPGGTGSGMGSGPESGCSEAVTPVTFTCDNGTRKATVKDLAVGVRNNQLVLSDCDENETDLGPCSPNNPDGTQLPVVTKVCPEFVTLDQTLLTAILNGETSLDVVVGITVERRLVTVPVADEIGCATNQTDCCPESGSGEGSGSGGCVVSCDQCVEGMAGGWIIDITGIADQVMVFYVSDPDDGNECRWVSDDLTWELRYDYVDEQWVLINFDTEQVWYIDGADWTCLGANVMLSTEEDTEDALVTPGEDCSEVTYNCVGGECVGVGGTGGTYATLEECQAVCGDVATDCCPSDSLPTVLKVTVTGVSGTCGCIPSTFLITNPNPSGLPQWESDVTGVCGNKFLLRCIAGAWRMQLGSDAKTPPDSATCNPFGVTFVMTLTDVCSGAATFTITRP